MGLREVPPSQAEVLNPPLLCHCLMFDKEVNINIPTFFLAHFGTFYSYSYSFQRILANRAKKIFKILNIKIFLSSRHLKIHYLVKY